MEKLHLIKNIYVYLLSAITLIIFMVSLIQTLTEIPNLIYPDVYTSTFTDFKSARPVAVPVPPPTDQMTAAPATPVTPPLSNEELRAEWQESNEKAIRDEKARAVKRLINHGIWTIVSFGAFMYFQSERKKLDTKK